MSSRKAAGSGNAAKRKNTASHQVRIIGGQWKRSLLPVSIVPGLRPTPNRVRETVFNWLFTLFDGAWHELDFLDLFAGTGAFGFESGSRGAKSVTMVEMNRIAFSRLQETTEKLKAQERVHIIHGDALSVVARLKAQKKRFDVIFLDPPFESDLLPEILPYCAQILKENGVIYVETPVLLIPEILDNTVKSDEQWHIIRQDRSGHVCYQLLQIQCAPLNLQA